MAARKICVLSIFGDWPIFDILYALVLFRFREQPKKKWIWFSIITVCSFVFGGLNIWGIYQLGIFMVPLLMQFGYNGQSGSRKPIHKWFFYIFYPLHLLVLGVLQML